MNSSLDVHRVSVRALILVVGTRAFVKPALLDKLFLH